MRRLTELWQGRRAAQPAATHAQADSDHDPQDAADEAKRQAISPEQFDRNLLDVLAHR